MLKTDWWMLGASVFVLFVLFFVAIFLGMHAALAFTVALTLAFVFGTGAILYMETRNGQ